MATTSTPPPDASASGPAATEEAMRVLTAQVPADRSVRVRAYAALLRDVLAAQRGVS